MLFPDICQCRRTFKITYQMEQHPITLGHRSYVEAFTRKYPKYSDFNFTSMRCWDTKGRMRLGEIHGNLVVRFLDYITGEPFYSFLGDTNVSETADHLLSIAESEGLPARLRLVPECAVADLDTLRFVAIEDRDHFDYVYDMCEFQAAPGKKFRHFRQNVNSFQRNYVAPDPTHIEVLNGNASSMTYAILLVNERWKTNKMRTKNGIDLDEMRNESEAIQRILTDDHERIVVTCLYYQRVPIGYAINELLEDGHAISHFTKTDTTFSGITAYLVKSYSEMIVSQSHRYLNCEQDLGVEGLRISKSSFQPCHFMKKYIVERK